MNYENVGTKVTSYRLRAAIKDRERDCEKENGEGEKRIDREMRAA